MSEEITQAQWATISQQLRAPFDPQDVDFRPQGNPAPNVKCQVVCYVEARAVADRLDDVVGAGNWSFDYTPLVVDKGEIQIAKGTLTIGGVAKSDVGDASSFAASKGCVSDALKRCAVLWGVGRYLYDVPGAWITMDEHKRIPADALKRLRAALPRPSDSPLAARATIVAEDEPAPTSAAAPAQKASADLSSARVPADQQRELFDKLKLTFGFTDADRMDAWLNERVRSAETPRGVVGALKLRSGTADLNMAEQSLILGILTAQTKTNGTTAAVRH